MNSDQSATQKLKRLITSGPVVMGILNVTPDSFSDGGLHNDKKTAVQRARRMMEQGAHIIDIGGESTRPGAQTVSVEEEIRRTVPVIEALKDGGALLSIDTRNARTMRAALDAGAHIINDVTALTHDPRSMDVAISADVPVCLMHMKGTPQTMQAAPEYENVVDEVKNYLLGRAAEGMKSGIKKENIILDPGIGFGKTPAHNIRLLQNLEAFTKTGFPVLLGASRKSFIEKICADGSSADQRVGGSIAAVIMGAEAGVKIFRVHDVRETVQALKIWSAIQST